MPSFRFASAIRAISILFVLIFSVHFILSLLAPPVSESYDPWSERLGLDHYADWEAGFQDTLGDGIDRVKDGLGVIKGGLGWGEHGRPLGSLYELIMTSNPTPRPAYFDARSSIDRLRLSSSRVVGHSAAELGASEPEAEETEELAAAATRARRHILITGGFGSVGKHVVRDLLLGLSGRAGREYDQRPSDDGGSMGANDEMEEDIFITLLDVKDRTEELNHLLQTPSVLATGEGSSKSNKIKNTDPRVQAFASSERTVSTFKKSGKLRVVVGDVRDTELIMALLTPDSTIVDDDRAGGSGKKKGKSFKGHTSNSILVPPVSGIIHLAAYGPKECRLNPVDCEEVEGVGMGNILKALERTAKSTTGRALATNTDRPWVVVPRKGEAWADIPDAYHVNASTRSLPYASLLIKDFTIGVPLHTLFLRLPSVHSIIGDPFASRFDPVPHLIQSALGDLPIQVHTPFDEAFYPDEFIAMDDVALAVVQGARMLELASKKSYLKQLGFVSEVDILGPPMMVPTKKGKSRKRLAPMVELAEEAISVTLSQSPFAETVEVQLSEDDEPATRRRKRASISAGSDREAIRKTTSRVLGFTPSLPVRQGIKSYVESVLTLQSEHLQKKINVACSSPPPVPVLEEGILALTGCNVQLLTIFEGAYYTLGCSAGLEEDHYSPLAVVSAVPFKEGVRGVEVIAERGMEGKVDLQLRCPTFVDGKPTGDSEVVVWADTSDGGEFSEESVAGDRTIAEWFTVDFIRRDARAFTITLPPTEGIAEGDEPRRSLVQKDPTSSRLDLIFQPASTESRPLLWRVNPICCSSVDRKKDLWDFFKEDPVIASQVTFPSEDGRTTLSDSTLAVQRCADSRSEHDRIVKLRKHLKTVSTVTTRCEPERSDATEWDRKDSVICQIDCAAPLPCLASKHCKCTRDRCGDPRRGGPFPDVAYTNRTSFPPTPPNLVEPLTLAQRISTIPWESVILPAARKAFVTPFEDLPRANVIELPRAIDTHLHSVACYDLDKSPLPFMGDHMLIEALRNESVPLEDADFAMVPYYQGCYYNYLQENMFKKLAETVGIAQDQLAEAEGISMSQAVIPFTHDFGSCTGWWPRLEDVLGRSPPSPMDRAYAWQVNGDTNTRCVKPDRDVVVPAISKHSKALFGSFGAVKNVRPVGQRKHLAFFAGGVRGFGAVARTRIGCGRTNQDPKTATILYQQFAEGQRYLGTLNSAKFCLLPRGIPAWTTRTFEAIYAGCIPAFIVDRNLFPFQDILDYSLFSVTIPENEAHRAEEILSRYSTAQLFEMQAHLLKVREAFLFKEGKEWERRGPLFYSLMSMAMRLDLEYPVAGTCGAPVTM